MRRNWAVNSRLLLIVVPDLEQHSRCRVLQPPTLMLVRESSHGRLATRGGLKSGFCRSGTVRVWEGRVLSEEVAEFMTTVPGLLALRDWLEAFGVTPGRDGGDWRLLEAGLGGARGPASSCLLVNARHVKAGGVGLALHLLSDGVVEQSSLVGFDLDS